MAANLMQGFAKLQAKTLSLYVNNPKKPNETILTQSTIKLASGETMALEWVKLESGETFFRWVIIEQ